MCVALENHISFFFTKIIAYFVEKDFFVTNNLSISDFTILIDTLFNYKNNELW